MPQALREMRSPDSPPLVTVHTQIRGTSADMLPLHLMTREKWVFPWWMVNVIIDSDSGIGQSS